MASLHRRHRGVPWLRALLWCTLFVAFLLTGFQTGYRAHAYLSDLLGVIRISPGGIAFSLPSTLLTTENPEGSQEGVPQWGGRGRVNILILGIDRRDKGERAARTDTMMVASLDPVAKSAVILSIPRDLWVSIPGYGEGRINTAYFYGELEGQGPALAQATVEENLGIPIGYYLRLDFEGFKKIVDTLGGVSIEVETPIHDDMFPDDNYGYRPLYIPAGRQEMDGETLLQYVRTRHGGNDFERMGRQQQVLRALAQQALHLNLLPRLPTLIDTTLDAISTDLQPLEILALANLASQIGLDNLKMRAIDESLTTPFVTLDGAQILLPDKAGIEAMLKELFAPSVASLENDYEGVKIVIKNGTPQVGLAEAVADLLYRRGYDVQEYVDLESSQYEGTAITSREESMELAQNLAGLLGIDWVSLASFEGEDADITILLGRGFAVP